MPTSIIREHPSAGCVRLSGAHKDKGRSVHRLRPKNPDRSRTSHDIALRRRNELHIVKRGSVRDDKDHTVLVASLGNRFSAEGKEWLPSTHTLPLGDVRHETLSLKADGIHAHVDEDLNPII